MATRNWTGNAGDNKWETNGNWSSNTAPAAGDIAQITPTANTLIYLSSATPALASVIIGANGHSNTITLQLNSVSAGLTTTGAITIAQANVVIDGQGAINAAGGITLSGSGSGAINAGTVTTGGTLDITGAIAGNIALGFANTTVATTLKLESTSSLNNAIAITSSTQTLEIGATANVTFSASESITNGKIQLDGGVLTVTTGLTLGSGASLIGKGTVGAAITGSGTITANGGAGATLTLTNSVSDSGAATSLVIANGSSLILTSTYGIGSASVAPTLTFQGTGDLFQAVNASIYNFYLGTISGFAGTDLIKIHSIGTGDTLSYSGNTLTITNGATTKSFTFAAGTSMSEIKLTQTTINGVLADVLSICFMPGTMIRTGEGEAPVETLKRGDLVLTVGGTAKPVSWMGRQTISARFADPARSFPIRIKAGALADNVPSRDLLVSPDHALLIDGVLVHAGALVNELSITRETQVPDSFVYYHVELDDHSLILAENVPAETFVDNVERLHFDNWGEHEALYPGGRAIAEMPFPRVRSRRQLPEAIASALLERARLIGLDQRDVA